MMVGVVITVTRYLYHIDIKTIVLMFYLKLNEDLQCMEPWTRAWDINMTSYKYYDKRNGYKMALNIL